MSRTRRLVRLCPHNPAWMTTPAWTAHPCRPRPEGHGLQGVWTEHRTAATWECSSLQREPSTVAWRKAGPRLQQGSLREPLQGMSRTPPLHSSQLGFRPGHPQDSRGASGKSPRGSKAGPWSGSPGLDTAGLDVAGLSPSMGQCWRLLSGQAPRGDATTLGP